MSTQTRLSARGQVVIPYEVRERLRWHSGMRFDVVERSGSVVLRPLPDRPFAATTLADLAALPRFGGQSHTVEEVSGLDDASLFALLAVEDRRD